MNKYSVENLEKVTSYVEEYFRSNDSFSKEFLIDEIPLTVLRKIFNSNDENDTELYLTYEITEEMASEINRNLADSIDFDFEKFEYFLQRVGTYK
jgi:hypothetical protein